MAGPSYKSLLAAVIPYACIGAGEDADALALLQQVDCLMRAPRERALARQKAVYAANPEPFKAKARKTRKQTPERRRERYQEVIDFKREAGREVFGGRPAEMKARICAWARRFFCWHDYINIRTYRITDRRYREFPSYRKEWITGTCRKCGHKITLLTGR